MEKESHTRPIAAFWAQLSLFCAGAALYGLLEVIWRGRTHWTMLLAGGAGLLLLYRISRCQLPFGLQCLLGAAAITGLELVIGLICNRLLCWSVWDYSDHWGNLLGQICPEYSLLWLGLSGCILRLFRLLEL